MRHTVVIALVAVMVALAGCGATTQGSLPSDSTAESDTALQPTSGTVDGSAGTIAFYVSDEPAAIEDFEHLNVTIEKIGLQKKGAEGAEDDMDEADGGNDTEANESEELDDKDEREGWVTYEVDNRTVDLTELKGENATRLADLTAPNGTYTAVFVHVSAVEGVLDDGERVNVKLPSQKLQLHTTFEVGPNASTDFVYDIAVHKAGNSGKYILKPNIAESGTDVKIRDIDEDDEDSEREDEESDGEDEEREDEESDDVEEEEAEKETELSIAPEGNVSPGETVTLLVTDENESAVAGLNLSVEFGDAYNETIAQTDEDGRLEVTIPEDAEEVEIEVADAEIEEQAAFEGEFEYEFEDD